MSSQIECRRLAAQMGWPEMSKTSLGTDCWRLVDWLDAAGLGLHFDAELVRRAGGPFFAEGNEHFYAVLIASTWDEVEAVLDAGILKQMGIATPWSQRQERLTGGAGVTEP